ncbi:unnamed protein product [Cyclocybe aegerita]|uniref:Uncharacterized protein n=1 Tax=Cyclocybe aegerita TaxID=1973307 RepID=A0A8S0XX28_CYCAE|nr:unnamed protein product [Cyclocybe aegerita]
MSSKPTSSMATLFHDHKSYPNIGNITALAGAAIASADPKSSGPATSTPQNAPEISLIQEIKDFLATAEGGEVFCRPCALQEFEIFIHKAKEGLFGLDGKKIKLSYMDGGVIMQWPSFLHEAISPILMAARGWGELPETLVRSCGVPTIRLFDGEEYKVPDHAFFYNSVPGLSSAEPMVIFEITVAQAHGSVNYVAAKWLTGTYGSVHLVITININLKMSPNPQGLKNKKGEIIRLKELKELSVESWASIAHDSLLLEDKEAKGRIANPKIIATEYYAIEEGLEGSSWTCQIFAVHNPYKVYSDSNTLTNSNMLTMTPNILSSNSPASDPDSPTPDSPAPAPPELSAMPASKRIEYPNHLFLKRVPAHVDPDATIFSLPLDDLLECVQAAIKHENIQSLKDGEKRTIEDTNKLAKVSLLKFVSKMQGGQPAVPKIKVEVRPDKKCHGN